jgi:AAA domain/MarR family
MTESPREAARRLSENAIAQGYNPIALHTYHDEDGQPVYWRIRLKNSEGEKWIRPMRLNGHGWELKEPDFPDGRKVLYNQHLFKQSPDKPVWITEGEQKADALTKLGLLAATSGSATSADTADWTPLKGRKVILWPDNDQAGRSYAGEVAKILLELHCEVSTLDLKALGLAEQGDVVDWLECHPDATAADVEALRRIGAMQLAPGVFKALALGEFLQMEIPVPAKLLSPLITKQSLSMVYAWRGVGKTWFGLGIAYAIASGGKFLRWEAPQPSRVLYLDGEMPANSLQKRLATIVSGSDKEPPAGYFNLVTPDLCGNLVPDLVTQEGQAAVDELIVNSNADFVVVDNLSCWVRSGGAENDAESWRPMSEWLLRHRSKGLAILLIHHSGKGGQQRGTSKKEDILDLSLELRHPPDYQPEQGAAFAVEFKKSRHLSGNDAEPFEARLAVDDRGHPVWTITAVKESTYERVVELANLGLTQKEIAEELGIHKSNVSRHWNKAVEVGLITLKGGRNEAAT